MGFVYLAVFVQLDVNLCGLREVVVWLCMHIQNENYNSQTLFATAALIALRGN